MKVLFVFLAVLCALHAEEYGIQDNVVMVMAMFRHGARSPVAPYIDDKYVYLWKDGPGQLLDEGKRGQYELGKYFRGRYNYLLDDEYNPKDIYVQSTDVDRTIMSAQCNLCGLYSVNSPSKNWNSSILWQPIPVHTFTEAKCPKYDQLLDDYINSPDVQKELAKYKQTIDLATAHMEPLTPTPWGFVYALLCHDTLKIEESLGLFLPNWSKAIYPNPLKLLNNLTFRLNAATPEMARLKIGSMFKNIVGHMQDKVDGNTTKKMIIYSGHDTNIADVLTALNLYNSQPPYNSSLLFELRLLRTIFYVTVYYRDSSEYPAKLLTIPGCTPYCPFEKFKVLLSPLIPEDLEKECQVETKTTAFKSRNGKNTFTHWT